MILECVFKDSDSLTYGALYKVTEAYDMLRDVSLEEGYEWFEDKDNTLNYKAIVVVNDYGEEFMYNINHFKIPYDYLRDEKLNQLLKMKMYLQCDFSNVDVGSFITHGKIYRVIEINDGGVDNLPLSYDWFKSCDKSDTNTNSIRIINDTGVKSWYCVSNFKIPVEYLRDKKLNKLLK